MKRNKKSSKKDPFWILWVPGSHIAPQRRYKSLKEADKIAHWLIKDKACEEVYTLKPVRLSRRVSPKVSTRKV